ncbi:MAG: amidohydrolase [Anaerolineae bacterium]|nr:amidohydrolase [Anaerolineae bacterium]
MVDFKTEAEALREELIERRRDLHRHPELAFEEFRTGGIVAQELNRLGFEVQTGVGKTGVVGILEGAHDGPTVLVRADMDALPIQEQNAVDYASETPGKMHACGHDGHTTIALGVAKLLAARRDQLAGRVKFVFQPAEETAQGAKSMIRDGALQNPRPDVSIGLHLWNSLPLGSLGVADGPIMAGSSEFTIHVEGKGGHAASPHLGRDPVLCAAQLITQFQTIPSRNLDPFDSAVISTTMMRAGTAFNVIPQNTELMGTLRFFRREVRDQVVACMAEMVEHTCLAMGCVGTMKFDHQTEPVNNDPAISGKLRECFKRIEGVTTLDMTARTMGAEDVGFFMSEIPGMYFFVGAADPAAETYYGHHHPRFSIDENALPFAAALLASAVAVYVLPDADA